MKKTILILVLIFTYTVEPKAQCAYTFSTYTANYQPLSSTSSVNQSQVWTINSVYNVPLGFSLQLADHRSTTSVNVFAGKIVFPTNTTGQGTYQLLLYHWPFGGNMLTDNGFGTTSSLSPISHQTIGTAGNRIAKIEFSNAGLEFDHATYCNGTPTGNDYVNFQYWLYESDGRIEVHFGPYSVSNPSSYNCGSSSTMGPYMKFIVDDYFLNPYSHVNAPAVSCFNNAGIVYGNPMNGSTGSNGRIHRFDLDTNYRITTGISTNDKTQISIYPNPSNGDISIQFNEVKTNISLALRNSIGELILMKQYLSTDNIKVNWNGPSGLYFIQLTSNSDEIETYKLIKY